MLNELVEDAFIRSRPVLFGCPSAVPIIRHFRRSFYVPPIALPVHRTGIDAYNGCRLLPNPRVLTPYVG